MTLATCPSLCSFSVVNFSFCLHTIKKALLSPIHSSTCSNLSDTCPCSSEFTSQGHYDLHVAKCNGHESVLLHPPLDCAQRTGTLSPSWLPWCGCLGVSQIFPPWNPLSVLHCLLLYISTAWPWGWIVFSFPFCPIFLGNRTHSCWFIYHLFCLQHPHLYLRSTLTHLTSPFACFTDS